MSKRDMPPSPPHARALQKQNSWSPELIRYEAWQRKKKNMASLRLGRRRSVTDDDLEELKGCMELGFGFDSESEIDPKLHRAFPALGLYQAVNRLSRTSSVSSVGSVASEADSEGSMSSIYDHGDDPESVKTKLRHWAHMVAWSVRQSASNQNT